IKEYGLDGGRAKRSFAHHFDKDGAYYIKISDFEEGGSPRHFYRIMVGKFPLALAAYPLGVEKGKTEQVTLSGYNLGAGKLAVAGEPSPKDDQSVFLRPKVRGGKRCNESQMP